MNSVINYVEQSYFKKNLPEFRVGDTVRLDVKVVEGSSERIQAFEGVVISKRGHGLAATFTVRKTSFGVGVERTFPLHNPRVEKIKVIRSGKVRRAKLYYLRELSGKAARIQEADTAAKSKASQAAQKAAEAPSAPSTEAAPAPAPKAKAAPEAVPTPKSK